MIYLIMDEAGGEQKETDPLNGARILVVDDEESIRNIVSRLLISQGATVTKAVNGRDALGILRGEVNAFDLIITDVTMPEMNGVAFCKTVKEHGQYEAHAHTPIIILSSHVNTEARKAEILKESQADGALPKPFEVNDFYRTVRKTIIRT